MSENFGKDYFYGRKKSNYLDYDKLDPSKQFKSVISFVKNQKLKGRCLDVGCAFGLLLKELLPFFKELYGCDISQYAINKAKQKVPEANLKVINLDDDDLPYPNEFFDCIMALDVLEHTKKFEDNFRKITSKLKTGGYLIIRIPIDSWPRKLFGFLDKDKTHISVLKKDSIMKIANSNKLTCFSKKYYSPCPIKYHCPCSIFYRIPFIPAEIELIFKKF